ncbi:MAG: tetratricopeptide repeat protein [Bacteroidales bacterium]|nr:tetratricopeptide repeat protein [Bacteroidales bacterium]
MKYLIHTLLLLLALSFTLEAQTDRREVRAGNRKFKKEAYKEAEIDYRKAVVKDSLSVAGNYNLASSLYRQQDWDGAGKALQQVKDFAPSGPDAAKWYYNTGDVALQKKDYAAAVKAFREALLLTPDDLDAKENYIYAKLMLQNQQNGGGGDNQQNQDQQDQNQDQDQDQDQQQDQQNQQGQQDQQDQQDQQQQQQDQKISPQQAQQMLQAIQAKEKETQDKVKKEKAELLKSRQKEKNW